MRAPEWWDEARVPIAFLVAPLAVPPVAILCLGAPPLDSTMGAFAVIVAVVAYVGTVIFGGPLYLILRSYNVTTFPVAPGAGAAVGMLTMWLMWVMLDPYPPSALIKVGGFCGAAVGTVLWLIARPDRPQRS